MISLNDYIRRFATTFPHLQKEKPWTVIRNAHETLIWKLSELSSEFKIFNQVAIHESVTIDSHAIIKGPAIISANCFVGAHSYLRGGVFS